MLGAILSLVFVCWLGGKAWRSGKGLPKKGRVSFGVALFIAIIVGAVTGIIGALGRTALPSAQHLIEGALIGALGTLFLVLLTSPMVWLVGRLARPSVREVKVLPTTRLVQVLPTTPLVQVPATVPLTPTVVALPEVEPPLARNCVLDDEDLIYLLMDGEKKGPYLRSQIRKMWGNGVVTANGMYWHHGLDGWHPVTEIV